MNEINNQGVPTPDAAPQQPAYAVPQQPSYAEPQQPQYTAPQQPVYAEPQQPQQPQYAPPYDPYAQQQNYNQQAYQPYGEPVNDKTTLIFGIIALAAAVMFYTAPAGIVFGILAKNKASSFISQNPNVGGTVKTGKILGTIGFILGIVMSAILSIVILAAL